MLFNIRTALTLQLVDDLLNLPNHSHPKGYIKNIHLLNIKNVFNKETFQRKKNQNLKPGHSRGDTDLEADDSMMAWGENSNIG